MSVRFERAPIRWGLLPLVIVGGAVGSLARGLLTLPFDGDEAAGLAMLLAVNVAGCAALGFITGALGDSPRLKALLGTGLCGGFTSYSALAPFLALWPGDLAGEPAHALAAAGIALVVFIAVPVAAALCGLLVGKRIRMGRAS